MCVTGRLEAGDHHPALQGRVEATEEEQLALGC
jgi:hypothetical protein